MTLLRLFFSRLFGKYLDEKSERPVIRMLQILASLIILIIGLFIGYLKYSKGQIGV